MLKRTDYLTKNYGKPDGWTLAAYEAGGGYRGVRKALMMSPGAVVEETKKAHIRGRGGAGFDCGMKWSFMPKPSDKPHYLVVNADEGEPGTFKDRTIMEQNPHALIEGCIIGCYAMGAHTCYIYVRDELHLSKERLWAAIEEAKAKGYQDPISSDRAIFGRARWRVSQADILVAAVGVPRLVKGAWVKPGAAVIDVGVTSVAGELVGDVDTEGVQGRAKIVTPHRRGVGPMTITMLLVNTVTAYEDSLA